MSASAVLVRWRPAALAPCPAPLGPVCGGWRPRAKSPCRGPRRPRPCGAVGAWPAAARGCVLVSARAGGAWKPTGPRRGPRLGGMVALGRRSANGVPGASGGLSGPFSASRAGDLSSTRPKSPLRGAKRGAVSSATTPQRSGGTHHVLPPGRGGPRPAAAGCRFLSVCG